MQPNLITKLYQPDRPGYGIKANEFIENLISEFDGIEYDIYFKKSKIKPPEQKINVNKFQNYLLEKLNLNLKTVQWAAETKASETNKDRFDLSYEVRLDNLNYSVIIELDKCRSDQISKKFVSRTYHTLGKPTIYFTFCYPGTKSMSYEECVKYIGYCEYITDKLNCKEIPRVFIGLENKHKSKRRKTKKKLLFK